MLKPAMMEQPDIKHLNKHPLVSIIVITYNSKKYVIETLESAKSQTYSNVELIVTDDCSNDNTVEVCRQWIDENKERFIRAELITALKNTGIPANCNRGIKEAQGEWVKFIAGDDQFESNAIELVMDFVNNNPYIRALDSKVKVFNQDLLKLEGTLNEKRSSFFDEDINATSQLTLLANNLNNKRLISTLGVFLKHDLLTQSGGFDEDYPLLEDAPMWYKILRSGNKFYFLDAYTMIYRRHSSSISFNDKTKSRIVLSEFEITINKFSKNYLYPHLYFINKLNSIWFNFIYKLILSAGNKGIFAESIMRIGQFLQPVRLLWFQRKYREMFG